MVSSTGFLYALRRDAVLDAPAGRRDAQCPTCFSTPFGVTQFWTPTRVIRVKCNNWFLYALRRDAVLDGIGRLCDA
jgi:hypothetical protein